MSEFYFSELARGLRWDDPAVGINWPLADVFISDRDRNLPDLRHLQ
jgi:dTDP-4-dehydrorhamnose 3,5-epimerase